MLFAVDTGPIVALLDRRDQYHVWARGRWAEITPPAYTCEAVIAEACYLVRDLDGGPAKVIELVERGALRIAFRADFELIAIRQLVSRYKSVPMSFADACLVRMTELDPRITVLTLDADFKIYRRNRRQIIPISSPW